MDQSLKRRHLCRVKKIEEIKQFHHWLSFPISLRAVKYRHIRMVLVTLYVVLTDCVDKRDLGACIYADEIIFIILAYALVPKIQSVDPVIANPARIWLLHHI